MISDNHSGIKAIQEEINQIIPIYEKKCSEDTKRYEKHDGIYDKLMMSTVVLAIGLCAIGLAAVICALSFHAFGIPGKERIMAGAGVSLIAAMVVPIIMMVVISTIFEDPPDIHWVDRYEELKKAIAGKTGFASVSKEPQVFRMKTELKAGRNTGVQGVIKITAKDGTPFMTSIYGDEHPSTTDTISATVTLNDTADIQEWKNVPNFDEIELSYVKITLFPNIYTETKEWSFLLPCNGPTEELEKSFNTVCRTILHYAVLKELQKGISEENVNTEVVRRLCDINESIRSCFTKPESPSELEEESNELQLLQKSMEQIEAQVPMAHDQKADELLEITRQLLTTQKRTNTKNTEIITLNA